MWGVRASLAAVAVALTALVLPAAASAHANLLRTEPANGVDLATAPRQVRVVFDDVVRPGPGIEAIRNGGGSVAAGKPSIGGGGRALVVPLRAHLPDGAYSVRWAIISDDGHLESGVIAFAVGRGVRATPALTAEATGPEAADVVSRWLLYAGLLAGVGTALFALLARPQDAERVALLVSTACVVAAVGAGEEAHRVGLDTRAGKALGGELVYAVVVATLAGAAVLERRALRPALVLALGLVVAPAFAGHAFDPGVSRANVAADALHVLAAAAWTGALLGLAVFRESDRRRGVMLAAGGVVLLAATGVVRAWSELRSGAQLWDTSYGLTLLVKTGLLLAALALGWFLRSAVRRRAAAELAVAAAIVAAVSVLVLLPPGRSVAVRPPVRVSTAEASPPPPVPPADAVVLAHEVGELAVALHLEPRRTTAIVLSPAGGGLSGLAVQIDGNDAAPCGSGCYRVDEPPGSSVAVRIDRFGPTLETTFAVPPAPRPADALLRAIDLRFHTLRGVSFLERLASSPTLVVDSRWRLEAPDRLEYRIPGGADGIVIGNRRWDRAGPDSAWQESPQTQLPQPATQWSEVASPHVVASDATTKTITFVDPSSPAYFEVTVDAKTLLPRIVRMTAAAHFMVDRYVGFNGPRAIYPPR